MLGLGQFHHLVKRLVLLSLLAVSISACATRPPESDPLAVAEYESANDPFEPVNRTIFGFNTFIDKTFVRPASQVYTAVTPNFMERGVTNFLHNLAEPWTATNQVLQGKPLEAGDTLGRFLINSTVGILGLWDPAKHLGFIRTEEDLGQTLAVWGVGEGPYIMLPFFGPSSLRDTVGFGGDIVLDPMGMAIHQLNLENDFLLGFDLTTYITRGLDAIDTRARYFSIIDELYEAQDPYVMARSAWRQNRNYDIADGKITPTQEEEDLFNTEFDDLEMFEEESSSEKPKCEKNSTDKRCKS